MSREQIAADLLGVAGLEPGGFAPCPGRARHTKGDDKRDFRVTLQGAPTGFCFHSSCSDDVAAFNLELRRRIWRAEHGGDPRRVNPWGDGVAAQPKAEPVKKRPPFEKEKLETMARNVTEEVDAAWLRARSPLPVLPAVRGCGPDFLESLYEPGERVLVFTEFKSQGQFIWWIGRGGFRLSDQRGVKEVRSALPGGAPEGVWFLSNPVTGEWRINNSAVSSDGSPRFGRRHGDCITAWRYLVIESDVAAPDVWLRFLVQLPLRISAIYTSGGKSVHCLVRIDAASKVEWDKRRDAIAALTVPLGADPAAMTAVRLTRLAGCMRGERLQELYFLNPTPDETPITRLRRRWS